MTTVGEMLDFYGYNYDNIQNLGAEIEITIDNDINYAVYLLSQTF
jgi:hypothetical protein